MNVKIVSFRHKQTTVPILKVKDKGNQVIVAFIPFDGEHFTIHLKGEEFLLTYSSKHKAPSVHDEWKVEAARAAGYSDPEKHKDYMMNWNAIKVNGMPGYHIVGRSFSLLDCKVKEKYAKPDEVWDVPSIECTYQFYLSAPDNPRNNDCEPRLLTSLGDICVEMIPRPICL